MYVDWLRTNSTHLLQNLARLRPAALALNLIVNFEWLKRFITLNAH